MNTTIKKQNRILLAALIVLLASAGILIGVTGGANRKEKNELPPAETDVLTEKSETAVPGVSGKQPAVRETEKEKDKEKETTESAESSEKKKTDEDAVQDSADEAAAVMQKSGDTLPKFSVPVDNFVIKGYSADLPVFSYTMNDYRVHRGIDIACSAGTPVLAAADGQVCEVFYDPMMGVTVGIRHSGGAVTRCRGLSEDTMNLVKTGDEVKRGQVIGASGETALIESAEEAHVHFELTVNGDPADPGEYMKLTYLEDVYEG